MLGFAAWVFGSAVLAFINRTAPDPALMGAIGALALAAKPRILIADEPTTALDATVQAQILALLRQIQREDGIAVVLISHRMPDVFSVCDRIVVMRRGGKVADKRTAETTPEEITGLITGAIRAA